MNIFIVFLLTGIWHGADAAFIVWGLVHGLAIILERLTRDWRDALKLPSWLGHIYVLIFLPVTWILFRTESVSITIAMVAKVATLNAEPTSYYISELVSTRAFLFGLLGLVISFKLHYPVVQLVRNIVGSEKIISLLKALLLFTILIVSVASVAAETYNPFIYFRF
jgi:alginate O-acetyltransferase complex protein AlgI